VEVDLGCSEDALCRVADDPVLLKPVIVARAPRETGRR
jgi:hypothetical protein